MDQLWTGGNSQPTTTQNCLDGGSAINLLAVTGGSVTSKTTLPSQITWLQPVLQAQDGTFLGLVNYDWDPADDFLAAFDQSGNIQWSKPGYYAQIATADGGVIAQSYSGQSVTFDAGGNATGQMANMPTYSWKGAYQLGSTVSVVPGFDLSNMAISFAAVRGGNLTGNGFSLSHHTFGLFFCSTGPGGDGPCPNNIEITNMAFSYLANIDNNNYASACDFSASSPCDSNTAHPEWVSTIKLQALKSYTAAFASLPAIVSKGLMPTSQNNSKSPTPFDHTVYVDGSWQFTNSQSLQCPATGLTKSTSFSWAFYLSTMCGAQVELGPYGNSNDFTPPFSDANNFQKLVTAIGKAIGNVAAHETGHQLSFQVNSNKYPLTNMDCGTAAQPCEDNIDSVYEFIHDDTWNYVDWKPPIHWQPSNQCSLVKYLLNTSSCK